MIKEEKWGIKEMPGTDQARLCGCDEDFGSPGQAVSKGGCDPAQVFSGALWWWSGVKVSARDQQEGPGLGQPWGLRSLSV